MAISSHVANLMARGIRCMAPETITIAPEVVPDRLAPGTIIHPGCRLSGALLSIGPDCILGEEGPVTLCDCQLGAQVRLRGGFFDRATLLDHVDGGSCAHVRPGTLLEEYVSFGHSVGLKQTVLLPYMTMGSLINFCDCLMAGGTGKDNHSEVGSSYVHFNFTPHQEKATPSLIGDVPLGVMMNQAPIFLGGQGGLIGPCRIAYGVVLAAGQVCRKDHLQPGRLVLPTHPVTAADRSYDHTILGAIDRRISNNLHYLGNVLALDAWWRLARAPFARTPWQTQLVDGAYGRIQEMLDERMHWLDQFAQRAAASVKQAAAQGLNTSHAPFDRQCAFVQAWPAIQLALQEKIKSRAAITASKDTASVLARLHTSSDYLSAVRGCSPSDQTRLTTWLQSIVDACVQLSTPTV